MNLHVVLACIAAGTAGLAAAFHPTITAAVLACTVMVVLYRYTGRTFDSLSGEPTPVVPEALLLPTVTSLVAINPNLAVAGSLALTGSALVRMRSVRRVPGLLVLLLLTSTWVWLRPLNARTTMVAVAAAVVVISVSRLGDPARRRAVVSLVDGIGLYLVANVVGHLMGLESPGALARRGFSVASGGPLGERLVFPFATSAAVPAIMAAAFLVGTVALWPFGSGRRRCLRLLAIAAAVYVLLGANYRGPLVVAAGLLLVLLYAPRTFARVAPVLAVALLLLPFGYPHLRSSIAAVTNHASSVIPYLERQGVEPGSLSHRDVIWKTSIQYWADLPADRKLLGYGADGQRTSGASNIYGSLFVGGQARPEAASTHNSALQQLYDGGLPGLLFLLAVVFVALRRWGEAVAVRGDRLALAAAAVLFALVATAATEVSLAPAKMEVALWVLMVLVGASALGGRGVGQEESAKEPAAQLTEQTLAARDQMCPVLQRCEVHEGATGRPYPCCEPQETVSALGMPPG
jgi:hypothetical protein